MYRWLEKRLFPKADYVVCQSHTAASFFGEKKKRKIVVIPNPISADAIPPRYEGTRRHTVVGVGRLDVQKNFKMLISAFSRLPEQFSDYTLEIYGGGWQEKELQAHIEALGLQTRARLMGVKKGVMHYISDVALYVMSSDFEGFPNALVEAMATGLPVISTDFPTGVARELITEKNGKIICVGDEEALVTAMAQMLSDESRWEEFSLENRKLLEVLSEECVVEKWENIMFSNRDREESV